MSATKKMWLKRFSFPKHLDFGDLLSTLLLVGMIGLCVGVFARIIYKEFPLNPQELAIHAQKNTCVDEKITKRLSNGMKVRRSHIYEYESQCGVGELQEYEKHKKALNN